MQRKLQKSGFFGQFVKLQTFGLFLFVFHTCILPCNAQAPKTRINIQLLGPEQGLPSRNTRSLSQDGRGFMWVGTGQDLWRYDGYTFQNFTGILTNSIGSHTLINQIRTDSGGNIWVAHNNGVSIIDPIHFTCKTIDPSRYIKEVATKQNLDIFFDKKNNAWVALSSGRLVKLDKNAVPIALYTPPTDSTNSIKSVVTKLLSDGKSNVYAYSEGNFLDVIGEKANLVRRITLLGSDLSAREWHVTGVVQSGTDGITIYYNHLGDKKSRMRKYFLSKQTFDPLLEADTPIVPDLTYPDSKDYTWYTTKKEIGFLNQKTGEFIHLNDRLRQKSGAGIFFFATYLSSDDSFWISCVDGLFKITLTEEVFRKYLSVPLEKPGDIGSSIRGITEDSEGKIWVCSYGFQSAGEVYMFHQIDPITARARHMVLHRPKNIPGEHVIPYKVLFAKNQVYAITDGTQFIKINPESEEYYPVEFPFVSGRGFTSFYKLNDHTFWMGTWGGMAMTDTRNLKPVLFNDRTGPYIKNVRINHFMPWSHNRVLVSTTDGLYVLNHDGTINEHFGQDTKDKIKLPALQIFHSTWYENALWAGSTQGLLRIDTTLKKAQLFTTEDGLPDNNIYACLSDKRGNLWLSTNRGLSRFDTRTQKFYNYGILDGLPHMEFNHGSYLKSRNGMLYFGGLNGIVAFDPSRLDTTAPKEHGLQLISYSKYDAGQNRIDTLTNYQPGREIIFNPGDRFFAFSFMSPDYHDTSLNRFRYQLEGWNDDGWHILENGNKLLLNSLPSGDYKLRVQVSVAGADWGTNEWQATVKVLAPWYKSPWFFILSTLSIGFLIYLFYQYRLRQILHVQQIRNGISADMHDEIGGTLSSITFYSQALLMQIEKKEHQQVVQKIKENAQQVQEGLSDIIWSVKAGSDELQDVFARMFRFGSGIAESKGITFKFETDPGLENKKLDMQTRKNLYLIFKEAINNAAKYAECSALNVIINYENDGVIMIIRDNGRGFDPANARQGNGLTNMQQRAAQMKAKLLIQSEREGGTTISLTF
ncbi:two-component regulator propeller domain-containing protein [Dyadobacter sp. CY312]|uniref:ligand-binding sensor domain-containing protein n=1 Tax=Dyadobacter sp. CY312 TaxID=2907303 RepID=UPI001F2522AC|nr:sensor histidine kinase [Dyadobacter sp. CY312]MCE7042753.1 ATP-binding protein [Dyadobacter sp. CY312]